MRAGVARPETWPVVPSSSLRRGDVVQLPTAVDGQRVLRWIGPVRLAVLRRGVLPDGPYLVANWHGCDGPLVLSGRIHAAGARRAPSESGGGRRR